MIKKFKRFWHEWGITKEEFEMFLCAIMILGMAFILHIVGCIV